MQNITIISASSEKNILTSAAMELERGKTYFGMYIFFISDEFDTTELRAVFVASEL